jgi:hypothetical protein
MAYEKRKESCEKCEYLVQEGTVESPASSGRCVRFAPTELAAKANEPVSGPVSELFPFRSVSPINENWCGEFKFSTIVPLPVVP